MAKQTPFNQNKVRKVKHIGGSQALPVNDAPSNEAGDRLTYGVLFGLLLVAVATAVGALIWGVIGVVEASHMHPVDWMKLVLSVMIGASSVWVARSIAGLSLFGSVMIASKKGAWKALEAIGTKGCDYRRFLPGGASWMSTAVVQSYVSRGQYKKPIDLAQREWDLCGDDDKQRQNLGTLCFAAGLANQGDGDMKQCQMWNDRAIDTMKKALEQLKQPPKGMMAKLAATQSPQLEEQLRIQLAAAYFNCATMYFNVMDYRRAKENYRNAVEHAVKAPEFPQKAEIVKFSNEQLGRLKHS